MLRHSDVEGILRREAKGHDDRQMVLYGDQGYQLNDVIITPFRGVPGHMAPHCRRFNRNMSKIRIGIEHEFGRVHNILRQTQYEGVSCLTLIILVFSCI